MAKGLYKRVWDVPEIYRVRLPFSNLKKGSSNCYIVKSGSESLIVDTGAYSPEARDLFVGATDELGVDVKASKVFLTHMHFDHAEMAPHLLPAGTRVYASAIGVKARTPEETERSQELFFRRMLANGATEDDARAYRACNAETAFIDQNLFDVRYVKEGDALSVGDASFRVIATPGHTADHLCLYEPNRGILFGGDAVLYTTTPSIDPLPGKLDAYAMFIETLERLRSLPLRCVLLGHGGASYHPLGERVDQIIEKKEHKLERVLEAVKGVPYCTGETAARLSLHRTMEAWRAFSPMQRYYAMLECFVSIQHLMAQGRIERTFDDNTKVYRHRAL